MLIRENLRVNFAYLVQQKAHDGFVPLTIVRAGKTQQISMPVPTDRPLLIGSLQGNYPSYFILGPLVFERATIESVGAGARTQPDRAGQSRWWRASVIARTRSAKSSSSSPRRSFRMRSPRATTIPPG